MVKGAIVRLTEGKAVGGDRIPEEMWKKERDWRDLYESYVIEFGEERERRREWIEEWNKGEIVPIRNKGGRREDRGL